MIQYYSPNLSFFSVLKSIFVFQSEKQLIDIFKNISGKKYILLTGSCRSAMYLAYKSLDKTGEVITSPLTCKVAIDPIIKNNMVPVYSDIDKDLLVISTDDIENKISKNTIAIQAIHFGGIPCKMDKIMEIAKKHNLFVLEDCAQGLYSKFNGRNVGSYGDVACYSLIKNAYGIGGGILVTDNKDLYQKALKIQNTFLFLSKNLILFRIIRNIIESYRSYNIGEFFYKLLMTVRNKSELYKKQEEYIYTKLSLIESKISVIQLKKSFSLNKKRAGIGSQLIKILQENGVMENYKNIEAVNSCFTKFYITNSNFNSKETIRKLNKQGIESKHLENKYQSFYQQSFANDKKYYHNSIDSCTNYLKIHDSLISIPIYEKMTNKQVIKLINCLGDNIKNE